MLLNRIEITTDGNGSFLNAGATVKVQGWDGTTWVDVSVTFTTADPSTSTLSQYSSVKFDFFSNATAYTKYRVFGVSGTTRSNPDVYEAYFIVNQILAGNDLDNDGIPNQFDLDSDGDGCSDAIEGGTIFTTANLVSSSIPGGNSGVGYTGSSSSPVTQNLGNTVGNTTTTLGVPTIAGTGQTKAASQDGAVNGCTDSDGDAVADYDDLDDDNDGIQDIVECPSPPGNRRILVYNVGSGYNQFYPALNTLFTNNGYSITVVSTLPSTIQHYTDDFTNGYAVLFLFGAYPYTPANSSAINTFLSKGGGVYMNWEITCCETSAASTVSYVNDLVTGASVSQVPGSWYGYTSASNILGYRAYNVGGSPFTLSGNAYREIVNVPVANRLLASQNFNGSNSIVGHETMGFKYSAANLNAGNGVLAGFGDINIWYESTESAGNNNPSLNVFNFITSFLILPPVAPVCDLDGDGLPNSLDLDSDGDGCSDAIEGGSAIPLTNLVSSSMPGGNSGGGYTGSSSSPVTQNLGNTVGNTATTLGIPIIAGTGQLKGVSQDGTIQSCTDYDGDGFVDYEDLDDDNDGIQDIVECVSPPGNKRILVYNVGTGYNQFYTDLNNLFTDKGYSVTVVSTLPSTILHYTDDVTNGYAILFLFGAYPYSTANSAAINTFLSKGGGVYMNWEITCCETSAASTVSYVNDLVTGAAVSQVSGTQYGGMVNPGYTATNVGGSGFTLTGNAYREIVNVPPANRLLATANLNGSNSIVGHETMGFKYSAANLNAGNGVLAGFGDINIWYEGLEPNGNPSQNVFNFLTSFLILPTVAPVCDLDGDGIPNQFDLDSDGDGCSDAIEGGAAISLSNLVSSSIPGGNSGGGYTGSYPSPVTQNLGNTVGNTPTTIGIPTIAGTGQLKGVSQDGNFNVCTDTDSDGFVDVDDLDDDNDGILDAVESCITQTVSKTGVTASMTLTAGTGTVSNLLNGTEVNDFWYTNSQNIANQTITQFDFPAARLLNSIEITTNGAFLNAGATVKVQGWNGSAWVDTSPILTPAAPSASAFSSNLSVKFDFFSNTVTYTKYRIYGVSGTTNSSWWLYEAYFTANCTLAENDIDGDGILNQFDLDSDNDGCTDAIEGGASFTGTNLVTSTIPGGNTGATSGTYNLPVTQNLGNTVGNTATTLVVFQVNSVG